ncbi:M50 family metallopeptidase [Cryptosporangium aurantiacum]|uniref:Peptidase M50B-like n=1 Tax=Cryptosporangium aurantiacum TaxID=134849 RepID=A0A1M7QBD9_9ACTN|nr:M50 family metallopeptidase [Cryptosporangium aurantiacum]SHN27964.1 Peptidase M50B-like [Cryptosporangium aurantiacum]
MTAGLLPLSVLLAPTPVPTPSPNSTTSGRIGEITEQIAARQPSAPVWLVLLTGFTALLFVGTAAMARLGHSGHEGSHAFFAGLLGEVKGVTIPRRGNPATKVVVKGFSDFVTTFAGYAGPPLLGLLGAWLLSRDHPVAVLWLAIVLFVGLLWLMQNFYGVMIVLLLGGPLLFVAWTTPVAVQTLVAYLLVWSLLLIGAPQVRPLLSRSARKIDPKAKSKSDHLILREMTYVPQIIWALLHLVLCWAALVFGGWLLLVA